MIKDFNMHKLPKRLSSRGPQIDEVWEVRREQLAEGKIVPTEEDIARLDDELSDEYMRMESDGDIPDYWPPHLQKAVHDYRVRTGSPFVDDLDADLKDELVIQQDEGTTWQDVATTAIMCALFGFTFYILKRYS